MKLSCTKMLTVKLELYVIGKKNVRINALISGLDLK